MGYVCTARKGQRKERKHEKRKCNEWGNLIGGNDNRQEEEENDEYQGYWGEPRDVYFSGNGNGPPGDLDWEDVGNYGTDSEVGKFLRNNAETQGYEGMQHQTDRTSIELSPKNKSYAIAKGGFRAHLNNSEIKSRGVTNRAMAL